MGELCGQKAEWAGRMDLGRNHTVMLDRVGK